VSALTTIDIPDNLYEEANQKIEEEGFQSVSELIRYLLRRWVENH